VVPNLLRVKFSGIIQTDPRPRKIDTGLSLWGGGGGGWVKWPKRGADHPPPFIARVQYG